MNNMITFLLESAKHTIINTRLSLSAVGINNYGSNYHNAFGNQNTGTSQVADTKLGFSADTDLPLVWE